MSESKNSGGVSVDLSSITDMNSEFDLLDIDGALPDLPPAAELCGRIEETKKLHDAFDGVLKTKIPVVVTVHGVSGSGKTALVDSLREKVIDSNGYFCAGKFFQNSSLQEPYSAVLAAYSDICDLIVQSEDFTEERRLQIKKKLSPDGPVLTRAVSTLSHLIGYEDCTQDSATPFSGDKNGASLSRFKIACKKFLHSVSCADHPIVLFLDDIQWMDKGSRELIEMLLLQQRTTDLTNILIVLAYRDEEKEEVDHLFQNRKEENSINVVDIEVACLGVAAVHKMVCSYMGTSSNDLDAHQLWELSELVTKRTRGNPFNVIAFLEMIHFEGFLTYEDEENSSSPRKWTFDLAQIQSEIMVSDESADILQRKIRQLPKEVKIVLEVASLVGYRFSGAIVSQVASILLLEMDTLYHDGLLAKAVELGLIEATVATAESERMYNFAHDKIQTSFSSMLDDSETERLHLLVGEAFLSTGDVSLSRYCAAVHLNCVPGYLHSPEKRSILARINLEASKYCNEKSGFDKAASMLRTGLEVLGPQRWSNDSFDLAFELTETLARAEFVIGNFDASREAAQEALQRSKSVEMMIKSMVVDLELKISVYPKEIYSTANRALRTLDVAKMPRQVFSHHVILKFLTLKRRLSRMSDDDILRLPIMDDERVLAACTILFHVSMYGFYQFKQNMSAYTALVVAELTLTSGLSMLSSIGFVYLGILEMSLSNYEGGRRFEGLSMKLIERLKATQRKAICPTTALTSALLTHHRLRLNQISERMLEVSNLALEIGDVYYGCSAFTKTLGMMFLQGTHLDTQEQLMHQNYDFICNLRDNEGQNDHLLWLVPSIQLVVNLKSPEPGDYRRTELSGEYMIEEVYMEQIRSTGHKLLIGLGYILKAILSLYYGDFNTAMCQFKQSAKEGDSSPIFFSTPGHAFFGALCYLEEYRSTGKRQLLKGLRKYKTRLVRFAVAGNPNATPLVTALHALELSLKKRVKPDVLTRSFSEAARKLREDGLVHFEGLLEQQAGFAFTSRRGDGCREEAEHHFDRALDIFLNDWGALGPYNWLERTSTAALGRLRKSPSRAPVMGQQQLLVGEVIECSTNPVNHAD